MNNSVLNNDELSSRKKYIEIVNFIKKSEADLIVLGENNFPQ